MSKMDVFVNLLARGILFYISCYFLFSYSLCHKLRVCQRREVGVFFWGGWGGFGGCPTI